MSVLHALAQLQNDFPKSSWAGFYTLKVRELRHSSVCLVQVAAVAVGPGAKSRETS